MQKVLVLSFYVLSLLLDAMRAFYLSFLMFSSQSITPPYSYIVLSFFSLSPVLWFSLIIAEERGAPLRMMSLIKIFSVVSTLLFFLEEIRGQSVVSDMRNMSVYFLLFLCIDCVMLCFSLVRRRSLCK